MNQILLEKDQQLAQNLYTLHCPITIDHVQNHLKKAVGDSVKVVVLNQGLGLAEIVKITTGQLDLKTGSLSPGDNQNFHIIAAWPRPAQAKRMVEFGTSLGVSQFDFFRAQLSDENYFKTKFFRQKEYEKSLRSGLIQAKCYDCLPTLRTFPYSTLHSYREEKEKFFLDLSGETWSEVDFSKKVHLALGPERGWTNAERDILITQGFTPIKMHESTLKEEVALYCALSQLNLLRSQGASLV